MIEASTPHRSNSSSLMIQGLRTCKSEHALSVQLPNDSASMTNSAVDSDATGRLLSTRTSTHRIEQRWLMYKNERQR